MGRMKAFIGKIFKTARPQGFLLLNGGISTPWSVPLDTKVIVFRYKDQCLWLPLSVSLDTRISFFEDPEQFLWTPWSVFLDTIFNVYSNHVQYHLVPWSECFSLTFWVTLPKRCNLKTLPSEIIAFESVHALGENLKLFHWVLLINFKFLILNILMNRCTVCKKGHYPFSHTVPFFLEVFNNKKITFIKSTQWNILRFFPRACTRLFKSNNFCQQGLYIATFQQRYTKC